MSHVFGNYIHDNYLPTSTSIIEFLEKDPKRLRETQCTDLRSVGIRLSFPPSLAPPPREPGYEARIGSGDRAYNVSFPSQ